MNYDAWRTSGPHDDLPSVVSEVCDRPGCREPWAWEIDATGEKLCEAHADEVLLRVPEMAVTAGEAAE